MSVVDLPRLIHDAVEHLRLSHSSRVLLGLFVILAGLAALTMTMLPASQHVSSALIVPVAILLAVVITTAGMLILMRGFKDDASSRRNLGNLLEKQIRSSRQIAIHDPQTALLHRWYFELRVTEEITRYRRYGPSVTVLVVRPANRSEVNPSKEMGEIDLVQVFAQTLRSVDMAARVGELEYAVCLPQTDAEGALAAAERILSKHANDDLIVGVAVCPDDGEDVESLLDKAQRTPSTEMGKVADIRRGSQRQPFATIVQTLKARESGEFLLAEGQTVARLKTTLRRAAKRAGLELTIWAEGNRVHFKRANALITDRKVA